MPPDTLMEYWTNGASTKESYKDEREKKKKKKVQNTT